MQGYIQHATQETFNENNIETCVAYKPIESKP